MSFYLPAENLANSQGEFLLLLLYSLPLLPPVLLHTHKFTITTNTLI